MGFLFSAPEVRPARLIMLGIVHITQILPSADFYILAVSEWWTKTNIFDGLLAKFISTKNQTRHHFFLMAQVSPDQDLQIHRARKTSSRWEAKMSAIFFTRHSVTLPWGLLYDHLVCEVWSVHNLRQSAAG